MAIRFYLLPKIGDGLTFATAFRPAYVSDGGIVGRYTAIDYGKEVWMLVGADVTGAEHTAIVAHTDVTAVPANLDDTVGGALSTVQTKLELANLPADWVTSGMTWRTVVKWTIRILLLMQRFRGLLSSAARFFATVTLDSTVGDLSALVRQRFITAAASFGLTTTGITLGMTIRAALILLGQQMTFSVVFQGETV
jgi:hypothetical protein